MKKSSRRNDSSDDDLSDLFDVDERVFFYMPSEGINIEVLIPYLERFLGNDSDAEPGLHPKKRNETGYYVKARFGLSSVSISSISKALSLY